VKRPNTVYIAFSVGQVGTLRHPQSKCQVLQRISRRHEFRADVFAAVENYRQLKANESFLKSQNRISDLEERIADRREFFNDDVNTCNTRIRQFPEVFAAILMQLQPREMFKVSEVDSQFSVKLAEQG